MSTLRSIGKEGLVQIVYNNCASLILLPCHLFLRLNIEMKGIEDHMREKWSLDNLLTIGQRELKKLLVKM